MYNYSFENNWGIGERRNQMGYNAPYPIVMNVFEMALMRFVNKDLYDMADVIFCVGDVDLYKCYMFLKRWDSERGQHNLNKYLKYRMENATAHIE